MVESLRSFHDSVDSLCIELPPGKEAHRDPNTGIVTSLGANGKMYRFRQLTPCQVVANFDIPMEPYGLRAVPRLSPARIYTNADIFESLVLFASDGFIIICEFYHINNLMADRYIDPAPKLNIPRFITGEIKHRHIPRPPNA